jgi:hypothetical protein
VPRVIVKRRLLLDDSVHIGNGDKDLCRPIGHGFGNGKLIQVARIIVVYGTPDKISQIAGRSSALVAGSWMPSS